MAKQLPDVGHKAKMIGPDGQYEPVDYVEASAGVDPDLEQLRLLAGEFRQVTVVDLEVVPPLHNASARRARVEEGA